MPCYRPLRAIRRGDGSVDFNLYDRKGDRESLRLPCGKCVGCRQERARQWTARCMFESRLHDRSSFITLTYEDEHLPRTGCELDLPTLRYPDVQGFLKRLRAHYFRVDQKEDRPPRPIRFFCAGEYGGLTSRPHYHLLLFGVDFHEDRKPWRRRDDNDYFRSGVLESLWTLGSSDISSVTRGSVAYVTQYVVDKLKTADYEPRSPPFCRMSLRPGIGAGYMDRYRSDFKHGVAVIEGRKQRLPRYFRERIRKDDPGRIEDQEFSAFEYVQSLDPSDRSDERLKAGEEIQLSRRSLFSKRGL